MLAVGPLGPQYCLLFAWYELGRQAHLGIDTLPTQRVPQKILKQSIFLKSLYTVTNHQTIQYNIREAKKKYGLHGYKCEIIVYAGKGKAIFFKGS